MKKILLFLSGLSLFMSCTDVDLEEQTIKVTPLDGYVAFANAGGTVVPISLTVTESSTVTQNLRIECPTGSLSDITVSYSFGGSAVFGVDFTTTSGTNTAAGGTIVIKRNTTTSGVNDFDFVNLAVRAATDGVKDGNKQLVITLTNATDASGQAYTVGRGNYMKSATVNFTDVN